MEYPMISFNNTGRPKPDGTVDPRVRNSTITVIIHEVGHNFFPMIVNSDERQWTWMDEGLNTFVQYLTEKEWDPNFPTDDALPKAITGYMKGDNKKLVPIMTNSESIPLMQFGPNGYNKPATALNILRETVMGRELFDKAFKEYATRWAFKRPEPADLFRTMEDASAVDLDWFWRGWFYGTEPVDVELAGANLIKTSDKTPADSKIPVKDPGMGMFVLGNVLGEDKDKYLNKEEFLYRLEFKNVGGLVTPIIVEAQYKDGTKEEIRLPAEIWRMNHETVVKTISLPKEVVSFKLDPKEETADINTKNNEFPRADMPSDFDKMKDKKAEGSSEAPKEAPKKEEPKKEEAKKDKKKDKEKKK
jgi:Peptidase family M1 domain